MRKYDHYFKKCPYEYIDIYRVLDLYNVGDPCLQHAVKKIIVAGGRGNKNIEKDIQEAIDTLERWKEMQNENIQSKFNLTFCEGIWEIKNELDSNTNEGNIVKCYVLLTIHNNVVDIWNYSPSIEERMKSYSNFMNRDINAYELEHNTYILERTMNYK